MKGKWIRVFVLLALSVPIMTVSSHPTRLAADQSLHGAAMGNPAAVYCADIMAYEYRVVTDSDGGQNGVCILPDTRECDQWDFYAGLCGREHNYCAQQGYQTETRADGQDSFAPSYAVCVSPEARVLGSVAQLSGLNARVAGIGFQEHFEIDLDPGVEAPATTSVPSSFDWRNYQGGNWLTSVKNQSSCGSCWAFAAVSVAEAHYNIVNNNPNLNLNFSEQELVSCSSAGSCNGGSSASAMSYMRTNGIVDENCFPYTATDSSCNRCSNWQSRLKYVDETRAFVPNHDTIRQRVVDNGPIYVYMGIGSNYGGYFDGNSIYRCTNDSDNGNNGINHAVVIVGYNNSGSYWIVRNSWGSSWNGNGYFMVGYNECNIDRTFAGYTFIQRPTKASNVRPDGWTGPYTNNSTPRFRWDAASDSGSGMAGYYVAVNDWTPDSNDWWAGNVTAFTVPSALPDGQHIFAVTSKDRFGNVNPSNTNQPGDAPYYTFYVDTVAPSSSVHTLPAEQTPRFNVQWSGSDAVSGIASYDVQYRFGTTGNWITWFSGTTATSAVFQATQEGTVYFRSRARDRAGNLESWPGGNGDAYTYVHMFKQYLPLTLRNCAFVPAEPYQPVGEIVVPSDVYDVRGVAEKDGVTAQLCVSLTAEAQRTQRFSNLFPVRLAFRARQMRLCALCVSAVNEG